MTMPQQPLAMNLNGGYLDGRGADLSPGLEADSQRFNDLVQQANARGTGEVSMAPTSVLQQRSMSPNGMSAEQAENRTISGAPLSNVNGMSTGTQEGFNMVRMLGGAG